MKPLGAIVIWFALGLALSALFWPGFWTGQGLIGGDLYTYFLPQKVFYGERLAAGELPLWNPLVGHGYPLVAESQTGVFYPPHLLTYPFFDVNTAYNLVQILQYALAFGFCVALGRAWGLSRSASALLGIVFVYGWFPVRITLEWAILTGAWMPAALWCVEKYLGTNRWRYLGGLALVLAMQMLVGHFHLAFITQVLLIAYAAGRILLTRRGNEIHPQEAFSGRDRFVSFGMILLATGLGFALAAIQLAPSWELKTLSQRAQVGKYYDPGYGHIPPWYLKQIVVPFLVYGTVGDLNDPLPAGSSETNVIEAHLYFGLFPVALVIYGLCTGVYWRDRRWWIWLLAGALSLVYATGSLVALTKPIPGFDFFRGVGRWGITTTMAVAALSGAALDAWRSRRRSRGLSAVFVIFVLALTVFDLRIVRRLLEDSPNAAQFGIFVEHPPIHDREDSPVRKELIGFPGPVRLFCRGPNLPTLLGVSSTPVYLGIGPDEYFDPKTTMPEPLPFDEPPTPEHIDWLQRAGVTHVLSFSELEQTLWPVVPVWAGYDQFLNRAWARAPEEWLYLYELKGSRGRASWLDPASPNPNPIVQEVSANRLVIETEAVETGTLVLTDLAYPGWQVTVDDEPAEWQTLEGKYRSVELPPGKHSVVWAYCPGSQRLGFWITGLSAVLIVAISIIRKRRIGRHVAAKP